MSFADERENDRIDILADFPRIGLSKTLQRLQELGMNSAEAWDEIERYINQEAA